MCNTVTLAAITTSQSQWPYSRLSPRQPAAVCHQVIQGPRQLPLSWSSSRSLAPQISSIQVVEGKGREDHIWKGVFPAHAWERPLCSCCSHPSGQNSVLVAHELQGGLEMWPSHALVLTLGHVLPVKSRARLWTRSPGLLSLTLTPLYHSHPLQPLDPRLTLTAALNRL